MRTETAPTIRLKDYTPPAYLVDSVHLTFALHPTATRVTARLAMRVNPAAAPGQDLALDGEAMELISAAIDGVKVSPNVTKTGLVLPAAELPGDSFEWVCETEISPETNTALEGLYMSKGMYCTQCEAEGFRKITYFPDRPDVMSVYTVRIEGEQPVLLSNGNPTASGPGWAEWHDPHPKPSYLFALVAGDLVSHNDSFTTRSGRDVALKIFVRPGDEGRCAYAMDALKRSMKWDEDVYRLEYDLDLFMIVAVDDFNMGAMENKGLNIFNSKYVLASPETATDLDYELIEGIIAHEYFHNWTGNRITCRDWFQLCLKEGLTVYRDQQFSADQRSAPVQRIGNVAALRARQFREDAGPLAHPVRPEEYIEINNFYTATVYEKGAEVIGMLHSLIGDEAYHRGMDRYFEVHDNQALTIEDWIANFEAVTNRDLSQFARWYAQAGTPRVTVEEAWDGATLKLTFRQSTPPTPGQPEKSPLVLPLAIGVLWPDGSEAMETRLLEISEAEQTVELELNDRPVNVTGAPIPSINRGFSAPIILEQTVGTERHAFLLAHDTDPFNRWESGRAYLRDMLVRMVQDADLAPDAALLDGLLAVLDDTALDPAFKALALGFPSIDDIFLDLRKTGARPDPQVISDARTRLDRALAAHVPGLADRLGQLAVPGPYTPDAAAAGKRALSGRLLGLVSRLEPDAATARATFAAADNMTQSMQALEILIREGQAKDALASFHQRWQGNAGVIDKWFSAQARATPAKQAVEAVRALTAHPDFDYKTPNRFRALIGGFAAGNVTGFHRADGEGYRLLADWVVTLDPINPQTAARMAGLFESWRQYDEPRQALMLAQLQRIADLPGLSKDTGEIVSRILDAPAA
ncbi:aminopeptidase N [Oceanibium sediminis]|uniref:aminopeptidase N n=1 Tax=Oceanibium sediminis TaxID=2026339 RepID=UPI000DD4D72F|nr:aminopeptidase N [Oceanibium sediminis]